MKRERVSRLVGPNPGGMQLSANLEEELAPEMARLAQSVGGHGLRQPKESDFRSAYGSGLKQFDDAIEMPAVSSNRRPE
jgi:hypothetical protein